MSTAPALSLVIAVKDGAAFLDGHVDRALRYLAARGEPAELVVVDDGSTDGTWRLLRRRAALHAARTSSVELRLLRHAANEGKGAAIRDGMLAARGRQRVFLDADLAFPLHEVGAVRAALDAGADVAYASRALPGSLVVVEPGRFVRHLGRRWLGRAFARLVGALLCPGVGDSQAGLKGFGAEAAVALFGRQRLARFAFDAELLFLARRLGLHLAPVPVEIHDRLGATTLHVVRDGLVMVRDVVRVRLWGWTGVYERAAARREEAASAAADEVEATGADAVAPPGPAPTAAPMPRGPRA